MLKGVMHEYELNNGFSFQGILFEKIDNISFLLSIIGSYDNISLFGNNVEIELVESKMSLNIKGNEITDKIYDRIRINLINSSDSENNISKVFYINNLDIINNNSIDNLFTFIKVIICEKIYESIENKGYFNNTELKNKFDKYFSTFQLVIENIIIQSLNRILCSKLKNQFEIFRTFNKNYYHLCIDGLDVAGKETLSKNITNYLKNNKFIKENNFNIINPSSPNYNTLSGNIIRDILKNFDSNIFLTPRRTKQILINNLMTFNRTLDYINNFNFEDNVIFIHDRWFTSSLLYNAVEDFENSFYIMSNEVNYNLEYDFNPDLDKLIIVFKNTKESEELHKKLINTKLDKDNNETLDFQNEINRRIKLLLNNTDKVNYQFKLPLIEAYNIGELFDINGDNFLSICNSIIDKIK